MTRRPRTIDFFAADDHRGTWTIRDHSRLRQQWRWVRSLPIILQIILALFAAEWFTVVCFVTWIVVGGLTMP